MNLAELVKLGEDGKCPKCGVQYPITKGKDD